MHLQYRADRLICSKICIDYQRSNRMYLGKIVEEATGPELYRDPKHPYTRALLAAIPEPAPTVDVEEGDIAGELPSPINPPRGCRFNTRCSHATNICFEEEPVMAQVGDADHYVACHHPVEGCQLKLATHHWTSPRG